MGEHPEDLRADCERCFGLCCVAPAFSASADFAIDKAAGQACPNLQADFRCSIHHGLREHGFPGCAVYDCFGAGQKVAQVTFGGQDWRGNPGLAASMFEVFARMRRLHELLWYLTEALALWPARSLRGQLGRAVEETERLSNLPAEHLAKWDLATHRREVVALLTHASRLVRSGPHGPVDDRGDADLVGRDLRGRDLSRVNLAGVQLIGADLRGADLRMADLIGADLRGANLGGADLSGSLFLTQARLDAAKGDRRTRIPRSLTRPAHWHARPSGGAAPRRPGP